MEASLVPSPMTGVTERPEKVQVARLQDCVLLKELVQLLEGSITDDRVSPCYGSSTEKFLSKGLEEQQKEGRRSEGSALIRRRRCTDPDSLNQRPQTKNPKTLNQST